MPIEVRATERGYYKDILRSEGDVFVIDRKEQLGSWMERTSKAAPTPEPEPAPDPDMPQNPEIAETFADPVTEQSVQPRRRRSRVAQ